MIDVRRSHFGDFRVYRALHKGTYEHQGQCVKFFCYGVMLTLFFSAADDVGSFADGCAGKGSLRKDHAASDTALVGLHPGLLQGRSHLMLQSDELSVRSSYLEWFCGRSFLLARCGRMLRVVFASLRIDPSPIAWNLSSRKTPENYFCTRNVGDRELYERRWNTD